MISSGNDASFTFTISDEVVLRNLIKDSIIYGSGSAISAGTIDEKSTLTIKTADEFSDVFIDLQKLFGHSINFRKAEVAEIELYVPKDSWITALKFNYKDSLGNFGGCQEITNNFYGNYDKWIKVQVDLKEALQNCDIWVGDKHPIDNASILSINPYNAHQADSSLIHVRSISLFDKSDREGLLPALIEKPDTVGIPFTMDFEDGSSFRKILAYRGFESTGQALARHKFGNESMALRVLNSNKSTRKHTCFLPMFQKITGEPLDFTNIKRIYFSYYITPESEDFDGTTLFLTGEHWNSILLDTMAFDGFVKGSWQQASIAMEDLDLDLIKGDVSPINEVYELRLDLNYRKGHKDIEMWIDDFGWE